MKLFEVVGTKNFYWGSRKQFTVGATLSGRHPQHDDAEEFWVEKALEHHRPKQMLRRDQSMYMVSRPNSDDIEKAGGYADHIYLVEPLGVVERNDGGWWSQLYSLAFAETPFDDAEVSQLAGNYWQGKAYRSKPIWEYRTPSFKILKEI